jgi:hypothetical protein
MLPATSAVAAVLVWTRWGSTQRGTLIGALLIAAVGVLVYALALEALPRERSGIFATVERTIIAVFLGLVAAIATLIAAGLGYYLEYRPFG